MFASVINQLTTLCRENDPYSEAVPIKIEKLLSDLETRTESYLFSLATTVITMRLLTLYGYARRSPS
jgi:hypothetical protein